MSLRTSVNRPSGMGKSTVVSHCEKGMYVYVISRSAIVDIFVMHCL